MLIRARAARSAAGCAAILLAAVTTVTSAPPASAAWSASRASALAAGQLAVGGFPSGAADKLDNELQSAWQITQGGGTVIAVLSTGVASVGGLSGKVTGGLDLAPDPNPDMTDGTILASAIAGSGPSGTSPSGAIGRAPAARILSVRVDDWGNSAQAKQYVQEGTWQGILAKGIRYAVDHGATVIVTDLSGGSDTADLASSVAYAISRKIPVITTGDYSPPGYTGSVYPDDLPGVISARGVLLSGAPGPPQTEKYERTEFALVSEPENSLQATGPSDQPYLVYNGYSAVAWLAGTVALIKSVYPAIPPSMIARALALTANYAPAGGYSTQLGFGLINPSGALQESAKLMKPEAAGGTPAGAVAPAANFGSGPPPGVIIAVHHSTAKLAGYAGSMVVGLVLLIAAFWIWLRGRRRPALAPVPSPGLSLRQPPDPVQPLAPALAPGQLPALVPDQLPVPVQEAEATGDQGHGEHGEHGVLAEETGLPEVELGG